VACSDATNVSASIRREGNELVINAHKWWTSGTYYRPIQYTPHSQQGYDDN